MSNAILQDDLPHDPPPVHDIALLRQLWPFIRPHWKALAATLVLLPLVALTQMAQPFILKQAVDGPIAQGSIAGLWPWVGAYLGMMTLHGVCLYWQMYLSQWAGGKIIYEIRTALYAHLQKLSPRFYQKEPIGKLVTRLTSDVENLSEMLSSGGISILADLAIITGALVGMFLMDWRLALVTSLSAPLVVGSIHYFRKRSRAAYDAIRVKVGALNAFLQENISGMETVQLFNRQPRNYEEFYRFNTSNLQSNLASVYYDSALSSVIELLINLTLVLILCYAGWAITGGQMSFGLLLGFFQFIRMIFDPLEDLSDKFTIIQSGLASVDKLAVLFNAPIDIVEPAQPPAIGRARGHIEFKGVSFAYQPDQPVLKQIDFCVEPGQKIALVGPSGSGKSTLIKLLCRFYDVTDGAITLDGHDLRSLSLGDLRRNLVLIQQDDFLFSRSVAENLALDYPASAADTARLNRAIATVHADQLIRRLDQGIETRLEERGRNLSSGERQLLLFARAVYHDPPVLILDEATSAIDPQTEHWVQQAMEKLMAGRTTILIAHRLSTIRKADRILVIDGGRIAESGTHDELLAQNGVYAQFCHYQALRTLT